MVTRFLLHLLPTILFGCAVEPKVEIDGFKTIRIGDRASLLDLAHVVDEWSSIKSAILQGDNRGCVKNNLSLESLVLLNLEPIERLAFYNPHYAHKPIPKDLKIIRLGFLDPCGGRVNDATDPHWVLFEHEGNFEVLKFIQVIE